MQLSFKKPSLLELRSLSSWDENNLRYALDANCVIGAYYEDSLVGFLLYSKPDWCIEELVVSENFRRKGIAKGLIGELVKFLMPGENIYLEVRSKNFAALSLYESQKFTNVGVRKGYYSDDDAIIMRRIV